MEQNLLEIEIEKYKLTPKGRGGSALMTKLNKPNNTLLPILLEMTSFLDDNYKNISIGQRLYHIWYNEPNILKCPICGNPREHSGKFNKQNNYHATCGIDYCKKRNNTEKTSDAILKKYGVSSPSKIPGVMDKVRKTNLENMVVKHHFK